MQPRMCHFDIYWAETCSPYTPDYLVQLGAPKSLRRHGREANVLIGHQLQKSEEGSNA